MKRGAEIRVSGERALAAHRRAGNAVPWLVVALVISCCGKVKAQHATTPSTAAGHEQESAAPANDAILVAMQQELAREQKALVLPGMQRPYFIEYRLEDLRDYELNASYGALTGELDSHERVVRVEVRVGDYQTDSSSAQGDGALAYAPDDQDALALRQALWTATDDAYKAALRNYAAKQAALKRFQNAPTAADFTPAKPVTLEEPLAELSLDRADWKNRLVKASGLFAEDPAVRSFAAEVQYSRANLTALAVNRYTVTTDGTAIRHGYTVYQDSISVGGQAPDGMQLGRDNGSTAETAAGLESWEALKKRTLDDLQSFEALREAPLVGAEDYHGPVLFSGDAAADVLNQLFVPNIEANRPDLGTNARTQGAYKSSYQTPVLAPFLSVKDEPTLTHFEGKALVGAYRVDDEGEPAQTVDVVDHGRLMHYLVGREPVRDFPESNGHGRAVLAGAAHPRAGVLLVESTEPFTQEQLHAKLLALAKEQGRDVYEVETLAGNELLPRLLYRVSPDGKRTLVRGAVLDELDQRSLRSGLLAAGGAPYIAQRITPVPETTIAPALLFADVTIKRASQQQDKLPYYPPPSSTGAGDR